MPSLLVPVDRALLDAMRARAETERTTLEAGELPQPELMHLDTQGIVIGVWLDGDRLRIGMTVHEPELAEGRLVGGDVLLHDHDITHLLERLGHAPPSSVAAWSAVPRLLPPNDVDLLRYELGLPVDARRNLVAEPTLLAAEDELDRELLQAVWANPASDVPRMIYADRLQQRADPRGELIALQLARGDGPRTARERELVGKWAQACARPLSRFLAAFELRRGFLARVMVDDRQPIPNALIEHPIWSTVEELDTRHQAVLLRAPLSSLRALRTSGATFAALSSHARVFSQVDLIVGPELPPSRPYGGVDLHDLAAWQRIGTSENWPALRTLSVHARDRNARMLLGIILRSPLGARLAHLDVLADHAGIYELDARDVHAELARAPRLQRLSLLAAFDPQMPQPVTLAFERDPHGVFELVLQLPPLTHTAIDEMLRWIAPLGRGVERIAVHPLEVPKLRRDVLADAHLRSELEPMFQHVELLDLPQRPRCPWAYSAGLPSAPIP